MSGGVVATTVAEAQAKAANLGCQAIPNDDTTVSLDLDNRPPKSREEILEVLRAFMAVTVEDEWTSRNGGRHMRLRVSEPLTVLEQLVIQACLGSDPVRELLGVMRARTTPEGQPVSYLFKPLTADRTQDIPS